MNEAQKLLAAAFAGELDLDADASGSSVVSGDAPAAPSAEAVTTEAPQTPVPAVPTPAQDEQEGAPIASKSGSYTIPYEKLTEARTARDSAIAEAAQLRAQLEQLTAAQAANVQQAQADAEADRFRLADLRYRNGVASYLDVLDAQRALFATQQALAQTQLAQQQNRVALYKALGGGWSAQAPQS